MDAANMNPENRNTGINKMYTLHELVPILGVSYRTMLTYVKSGKLKAVKIGRMWKVSETNLNAMLNGQTDD